jgi:hypothetical protein
MSFRSYRDIYLAIEAGQYNVNTFAKTQSQVNTAAIGVDLSMAPGNPKANYYIGDPLTATTLTAGGLTPANAVSPYKKYLYRLGIAMPTNANGNLTTFYLCDYLLFYSFIDMSDTSEQVLDNTISLPRYTTGEGVQMAAVLLQTQTGGVTFSVKYVNSDGTTNRTTPTITCNTSTAATCILNSNTTGTTPGLFMPLQIGDKGVRSITSITFDTADIGVMALILVKPIATLNYHSNAAYAETEYLRAGSSLPEIKDGAYLNLIAWGGAGSWVGSPFTGMIETIWG